MPDNIEKFGWNLPICWLCHQLVTEKIFSMAERSVRRVKLHSKYRRAQAGFFEAMGKPVPWLNVSGVWLEQAGFRIGDQVKITVKQSAHD